MSGSGFATRLVALTRKETRQMLRDRSNLVVGLLLPVVLILLFGYGISFDMKDARIAVVLEDSSAPARTLLAGLEGSAYLSPSSVRSMQEARERLRDGRTEAILRIPSTFARDLAAGRAQVQLILNGVNSTTATTLEGYVQGAVADALRGRAERLGWAASAPPGVTIVQRMWFNESGNSTWYLVPGLIVLVMTLIGAFLTSLLIAREWERGTLESLFVTPVRPLELVLAKLVPYLAIGAADLVMCLLAARYLFEVPMRGSLGIIVCVALLYLLVSLSLGLLISAAMKNQFAASQMALLVSFMPALMLSGFVFDLRNVPVAIQIISQLLPATHFMGLIKTLFMAGDLWRDILRDGAVLALYSVVLLALTHRLLRKTLE